MTEYGGQRTEEAKSERARNKLRTVHGSVFCLLSPIVLPSAQSTTAEANRVLVVFGQKVMAAIDDSSARQFIRSCILFDLRFRLLVSSIATGEGAQIDLQLELVGCRFIADKALAVGGRGAAGYQGAGDSQDAAGEECGELFGWDHC
jgi:hypothetical protein